MRSRCLHLTFIVSITTLLLSGCNIQHNSLDPYASLNKTNYDFNKKLKRQLNLDDHTPPNIAIMVIRNFVGNIGELNNMANDLLQLNGQAFLTHFWRLALNTTLGLGGLFDPASVLGLADFDNDFSLTLAVYSKNNEEQYVVLPFSGPTTTRQLFAMPFDYILNPFFFIDIGNTQYIKIPLNLISRKTFHHQNRHPQKDPYTAERDAYLSFRHQMIIQHLQRQ